MNSWTMPAMRSLKAGADVYAFLDSDAEAAGKGILAAKDLMTDALDQLAKDVDLLTNSWSAEEADLYYEAIRNWKEGSQGLTNVLVEVEKALMKVDSGTVELRTSIGKILDDTS